MNAAGKKYELWIRTAQVPVGFEGVSVPVEIIPEKGRGHRTLVRLSNVPTPETVDAPGRYLVRTALPSGEWLAEVADVPEDPSGERGLATLDFGAMSTSARPNDRADETSEHAPTPGRPQTWTKHLPGRLRSFQPLSATVSGEAKSEPPRLSELTAESSFEMMRLPDASETGPDTAVFSWGTFSAWESQPEGQASGRAAQLSCRFMGSGALEVPGEILPADVALDDKRARMLRVTLNSSQEQALVVWLPACPHAPLTLLPDRDLGVNRCAPHLLALYNCGDPATDLAFSYFRGGALQDARLIAPALLDQLQRAFARSPVARPDAAILAGYVLQRIRNPDAPTWIERIGEELEHLPDARILLAIECIRQGKAALAAPHFEAALSCGIPIYTFGIELLRDGLNFLSDLDADDAGIRRIAAIANCVAAAANLDSELTCLLLGESVTLSESRRES